MAGLRLAGILLLFSGIFYADLGDAASMKKDLSRVHGNKSVDLVSVLQEDLRKNNDDYKDIREPTKEATKKINNPYLGNDDAVNSEPETKGANSMDFARRNFEDKLNSRDKKTDDKNTMSSTKDTKSQDKLMLQDKNSKKDNTTEKTQLHVKNYKTDHEKIKSDEKFLKSHRGNIKTNNKESMLHDIKMKKDEERMRLVGKIWKTYPKEKVSIKDSMLHDKNMKANDKNFKSRLQDTKRDGRNAMPSGRKSIDNKKPLDFNEDTKVSSEGEVIDLERASKYKRNESRISGFVTKTATSPDTRRQRMKLDKLHKLLDKEGLLKKFLKNLPAEKGEGEGEVRNRAFEIESDKEAPPPSDTVPSAELDMLPATGERVEALKRKGRFCFRHVLFPEGPKYDSRGRVYEPAHSAKLSHRNFAHTRAPKQILPKCCNCCKKSVLGCE